MTPTELQQIYKTFSQSSLFGVFNKVKQKDMENFIKKSNNTNDQILSYIKNSKQNFNTLISSLNDINKTITQITKNSLLSNNNNIDKSNNNKSQNKNSETVLDNFLSMTKPNKNQLRDKIYTVFDYWNTNIKKNGSIFGKGDLDFFSKMSPNNSLLGTTQKFSSFFTSFFGIGPMLESLQTGLQQLANPATIAGLASLTGQIIGIAYQLKLQTPFFKIFFNYLLSVIDKFADFIGMMINLQSSGKEITQNFVSIGKSMLAMGKGILQLQTGLNLLIPQIVGFKVLEKLHLINTKNTGFTLGLKDFFINLINEFDFKIKNFNQIMLNIKLSSMLMALTLSVLQLYVKFKKFKNIKDIFAPFEYTIEMLKNGIIPLNNIVMNIFKTKQQQKRTLSNFEFIMKISDQVLQFQLKLKNTIQGNLFTQVISNIFHLNPQETIKSLMDLTIDILKIIQIKFISMIQKLHINYNILTQNFDQVSNIFNLIVDYAQNMKKELQGNLFSQVVETIFNVNPSKLIENLMTVTINLLEIIATKFISVFEKMDIDDKLVQQNFQIVSGIFNSLINFTSKLNKMFNGTVSGVINNLFSLFTKGKSSLQIQIDKSMGQILNVLYSNDKNKNTILSFVTVLNDNFKNINDKQVDQLFTVISNIFNSLIKLLKSVNGIDVTKEFWVGRTQVEKLSQIINDSQWKDFTIGLKKFIQLFSNLKISKESFNTITSLFNSLFSITKILTNINQFKSISSDTTIFKSIFNNINKVIDLQNNTLKSSLSPAQKKQINDYSLLQVQMNNGLSINPNGTIQIPNHQIGGFTIQQKDDNQIQGVVHQNEYVIPQWLVRKYPEIIKLLEQMRLRGYKTGGTVEKLTTGTSGGTTTISNNINVPSIDVSQINNTIQGFIKTVEKYSKDTIVKPLSKLKPFNIVFSNKTNTSLETLISTNINLISNYVNKKQNLILSKMNSQSVIDMIVDFAKLLNSSIVKSKNLDLNPTIQSLNKNKNFENNITTFFINSSEILQSPSILKMAQSSVSKSQQIQDSINQFISQFILHIFDLMTEKIDNQVKSILNNKQITFIFNIFAGIIIQQIGVLFTKNGFQIVNKIFDAKIILQNINKNINKFVSVIIKPILSITKNVISKVVNQIDILLNKSYDTSTVLGNIMGTIQSFFNTVFNIFQVLITGQITFFFQTNGIQIVNKMFTGLNLDEIVKQINTETILQNSIGNMTKNLINSIMNTITETFSKDNISKLLHTNDEWSKYFGIGLLAVQLVQIVPIIIPFLITVFPTIGKIIGNLFKDQKNINLSPADSKEIIMTTLNQMTVSLMNIISQMISLQFNPTSMTQLLQIPYVGGIIVQIQIQMILWLSVEIVLLLTPLFDGLKEVINIFFTKDNISKIVKQIPFQDSTKYVLNVINKLTQVVLDITQQIMKNQFNQQEMDKLMKMPVVGWIMLQIQLYFTVWLSQQIKQLLTPLFQGLKTVINIFFSPKQLNNIISNMKMEDKIKIVVNVINEMQKQVIDSIQVMLKNQVSFDKQPKGVDQFLMQFTSIGKMQLEIQKQMNDLVMNQIIPLTKKIIKQMNTILNTLFSDTNIYQVKNYLSKNTKIVVDVFIKTTNSMMDLIIKQVDSVLKDAIENKMKSVGGLLGWLGIKKENPIYTKIKDLTIKTINSIVLILDTLFTKKRIQQQINVPDFNETFSYMLVNFSGTFLNKVLSIILNSIQGNNSFNISHYISSIMDQLSQSITKITKSTQFKTNFIEQIPKQLQSSQTFKVQVDKVIYHQEVEPLIKIGEQELQQLNVIKENTTTMVKVLLEMVEIQQQQLQQISQNGNSNTSQETGINQLRNNYLINGNSNLLNY